MQATREGHFNKPSTCLAVLDGKELYTFKALEGDQCSMFWGDSLLLLPLWEGSHNVKPNEDSQSCFVKRDSGSSPGFHSQRI